MNERGKKDTNTVSNAKGNDAKLKKLELSVAYWIIFENDSVEFQLTMNYGALKKIPYYRDKDNNIIREKEKVYFRAPKEYWEEFSKYRNWFPYQRGIRRTNNFTVYEHRDNNNRPSGLYKIIEIRRNKETGEIKKYRGFYWREDYR